MNTRKIEKAIVAPVMQVITELSLYAHEREIYSGQVYTFYKKINQTIKIGYTNYKNISDEIAENQEFKVADNRHGSKREEVLLKATLNELGFIPRNSAGIYEYSNELIRYLKILGWPIGKL